MIKYDTCIRCGSQNVDKLKVNTRVSMNYPEQKYYGVTGQRVISPTDSLVCKDCGHIELFIDWTE
ncbi:MAG: hypothetical protein J6K62_07620 [Clostridia bacterium]|nr:hypothetical protein [Clostridia bacterium]